jgi:hypothetical protein
MFVNKLSNLHRGPSKDTSYQVSVYLFKRFQRRIFFRNRLIRNKNYLWRPCLLANRNEMSKFYRERLLTGRDKMCNRYSESPIDASYQASVHLAKGFQRRR